MGDERAITRRDVIGAGGATGLGVVLPGSPLAPDRPHLRARPRMAQGTVFHDRAGDGVRRPGDPGIAGVLVSNGVEVVATDAAGRWRLPVGEDGHVLVIKPTGWATPVRTNGLPAFACTLPQNPMHAVDFPLRPAHEPTTFEAALLADSQPQNARELGYLRDAILGPVADTGAAFAISHGDVVFDDLDLYPRYLDLAAATGMAWHHCPGNHDMDWNAATPGQSFETWRRVFGPLYFAFQHGGATFIVLNNVDPLPAGERTPQGYGYRGAIGQQQLAFVRNLLAHVPREALVVVSMHIPLVSPESPGEPSAITADSAALLRLLSGRPSTLSLAGHTHTTEHHYLGAMHGFTGPGVHHHHVLTAACGGWWSGPYDACGLPVADSRDGSPKGFHILSVDGSRYTTRFVPVGHAGDQKARLCIEGARHASDASEAAGPGRGRLAAVLSADECRGAALVVNVFDGGPRTSVTCTFLAGAGLAGMGLAGAGARRLKPITLQRRTMPDPYIADAYCRHKSQLKPWLEPSNSSHIWSAPLPSGLSPGTWRAQARIVDEYGRASVSSLLLEVVA